MRPRGLVVVHCRLYADARHTIFSNETTPASLTFQVVTFQVGYYAVLVFR